MPDLLTVPDVMARLQMSRTKIYDLIRSGRLCSFREGRSRRIPETALADYITRMIEETA